MSTVRRFNASCPDCGRWRCVCDEDHGGHDCGPLPSLFVSNIIDRPLSRPAPCPAEVRTKLQALRAEFAARAGR